MFNFFVSILGSLLCIYSYESVEPLLLSIIFILLGLTIVKVFFSRNEIYLSIFLRLFSIYWLIVGISSFYLISINDVSQLNSDAGGFYRLSSSDAIGLDLEDISVLTEGAAAVYVWRMFYDFFSFIGFEKEMYIGLLINVLSVTLAGVVSARILIEIFGIDYYRLNKLKLIFSFCGLFWLFSGVHLRDGVILLGITFLSFFWVKFIKSIKNIDLLMLIFANLLSLTFFYYLRMEFAFVPIAMGLSGISSIMFFGQKDIQNKFTVSLIACFGIIVFTVLITLNFEKIIFTLSSGQKGYSELGSASSADNSLGMSLIVNQLLPLRLILGTIYLFVFPIPFWKGLIGESVYNLYKSFNAIFFYLLTPMFIVSLIQLYKNKILRNDINMFLFLSFIGFTLAIAGTSLETRHFGAFLPFLFLFCLIPDFRNPIIKKQYKFYSSCFIGAILLVHFAWLVIKGF